MCHPNWLHLNTKECYCSTRTIDTLDKQGWDLILIMDKEGTEFSEEEPGKDTRSFSCFPDLSYAWTFNDNPLHVQEDNRRFVSQETGNLYIAKVEPSDVGNYTCFVTNREARRSVRGPPTPLVQRPDGKGMASLGGVLGRWLSLGGL